MTTRGAQQASAVACLRTFLPLRSARLHGRGGVQWSGVTFEELAEKVRQNAGKKLCGRFLVAARISPGRITVLCVHHILEPGRVVCVWRRISAVGCHRSSKGGWVSQTCFYKLFLRSVILTILHSRE